MAIFSIFYNIKVCCVFSLESPRRGDSYEYTQYTTLNIKKKTTLIYPKTAAMGFLFQGTQERVRNSLSKRAISVRATEVLLYLFSLKVTYFSSTVILKMKSRPRIPINPFSLFE